MKAGVVKFDCVSAVEAEQYKQFKITVMAEYLSLIEKGRCSADSAKQNRDIAYE